MKKNRWYRTSTAIINAAYVELHETHPSMSDEEIMRRISREHYPFGERRMWPYKQWLSAIHDFAHLLRIYRHPVIDESNPHQLTLTIQPCVSTSINSPSALRMPKG